MKEILLVVTLTVQGQAPVTLERAPQPDVTTCNANAEKAMERARSIYRTMALYAQRMPLSAYQVSTVCKESE